MLCICEVRFKIHPEESTFFVEERNKVSDHEKLKVLENRKTDEIRGSQSMRARDGIKKTTQREYYTERVKLMK